MSRYPEFQRLCIRVALALALLGLFAVMTQPAGLTRVYLLRQDTPVLAGLIAVLAVAALFRPVDAVGGMAKIRPRWRDVATIAGTIAILLWAGTYLVMENYPLTRDEHMVVFDMAIFDSGHLAAPLPQQWRPLVQALTPAFLMPLPGNAAWVSNYLPGNAMLRTAFANIADPALMNPLLVAVGAIALFDIARRIFPRSRSAQAVALLLYATSAQVLVTAMTSYAMTAHLALNLLWLALWLRGTRASHAGALAVGFVATGLHQIIFHPLFALPFIDQLRRNGQWQTAAVYLVSYAASGLFWLSYPHIVASYAHIHASTGAASGSSGVISDQILPLLMNRDPNTLALTASNLVRFVTWQDFALLPLMLLGVGAIRSDDGIARPLAYGLLLTIAAVAIILPYQGHGWGYRYLHGLIGSCVLLAAYGWRDFSDRSEVSAFVATASFVTVAGSLPFLLWHAHRFVHPYAAVNRAIAAIPADFVIVETQGAAFAVDEVRNRPDLSNHPIRLASQSLTPADVRELCSRGTIAFMDSLRMHELGIEIADDSDKTAFQELRSTADNACRRSGYPSRASPRILSGPKERRLPNRALR